MVFERVDLLCRHNGQIIPAAKQLTSCDVLPYSPQAEHAGHRLHQEAGPPILPLEQKRVGVQKKVVCTGFYKEPISGFPLEDEFVQKLILLHLKKKPY